MPVYVVTHDRMKIGSKVSDNPPWWVTEVRRVVGRQGPAPSCGEPFPEGWWVHRVSGPQANLLFEEV